MDIKDVECCELPVELNCCLVIDVSGFLCARIPAEIDSLVVVLDAGSEAFAARVLLAFLVDDYSSIWHGAVEHPLVGDVESLGAETDVASSVVGGIRVRVIDSFSSLGSEDVAVHIHVAAIHPSNDIRLSTLGECVNPLLVFESIIVLVID